MVESDAEAVAEILGGEAIEAGEEWYVRIDASDGQIVLISHTGIFVYQDEEDIGRDMPRAQVILS